jgi:hypothetical protein
MPVRPDHRRSRIADLVARWYAVRARLLRMPYGRIGGRTKTGEAAADKREGFLEFGCGVPSCGCLSRSTIGAFGDSCLVSLVVKGGAGAQVTPYTDGSESSGPSRLR